MDTKNQQEVKFWSCGQEEERLSHTDPADAIHYFLDDIMVSEWPLELELFGYSPLKPDSNDLAESTVNRLLEYLDEEFGDPEGDYSDPTDKMIRSAKDFVNSVLDDYDMFACEVVVRETIKTEDYLKNCGDLSYWLSAEKDDFHKKFPNFSLNQKGDLENV